MRWTFAFSCTLLGLTAGAARAGDPVPPAGPAPTAPLPISATATPAGCASCGAGGCASAASYGNCSSCGHRWAFGAGCGCGLFGGWGHGPGWVGNIDTWVNPYECYFYGRCLSNYALVLGPGATLPGIPGTPVPGGLLPVPGVKPPATLPPVAPPEPVRPPKPNK